MIDPAFIRGATSAVGFRVASTLTSKLGAKGVKAMQRINSAAQLLESALGLNDPQDVPQPLLGGVTLKEAEAIFSDMIDAGLSRKCLYVVKIEDITPPDLSYGVGPDARAIVKTSPLGSALSFLGGDFPTMVATGISKSLNAVLGATPAAPMSNGGVNVPHMFNLFATDVSYSTALGGEKISIGGATIDKMSGREPVEIEVTTLDDEAGTIKRWFEAKKDQAAHRDGTFGLPDDYCVRITIIHATPTENIKAFGNQFLVRPVTANYDLSRSAQEMETLRLSFTQFDSFVTP